MLTTSKQENPKPKKWEIALMIVALLLGFLLYFAFPKWIEIQEAGGLQAWIHDFDGRLAGILLFIAHLVR